MAGAWARNTRSHSWGRAGSTQTHYTAPGKWVGHSLWTAGGAAARGMAEVRAGSRTWCDASNLQREPRVRSHHSTQAWWGRWWAQMRESGPTISKGRSERSHRSCTKTWQTWAWARMVEHDTPAA